MSYWKLERWAWVRFLDEKRSNSCSWRKSRCRSLTLEVVPVLWELLREQAARTEGQNECICDGPGASILGTKKGIYKHFHDPHNNWHITWVVCTGRATGFFTYSLFLYYCYQAIFTCAAGHGGLQVETRVVSYMNSWIHGASGYTYPITNKPPALRRERFTVACILFCTKKFTGILWCDWAWQSLICPGSSCFVLLRKPFADLEILEYCMEGKACKAASHRAFEPTLAPGS